MQRPWNLLHAYTCLLPMSSPSSATQQLSLQPASPRQPEAALRSQALCEHTPQQQASPSIINTKLGHIIAGALPVPYHMNNEVVSLLCQTRESDAGFAVNNLSVTECNLQLTTTANETEKASTNPAMQCQSKLGNGYEDEVLSALNCTKLPMAHQHHCKVHDCRQCGEKLSGKQHTALHRSISRRLRLAPAIQHCRLAKPSSSKCKRCRSILRIADTSGKAKFLLCLISYLILLNIKRKKYSSLIKVKIKILSDFLSRALWWQGPLFLK